MASVKSFETLFSITFHLMPSIFSAFLMIFKITSAYLEKEETISFPSEEKLVSSTETLPTFIRAIIVLKKVEKDTKAKVKLQQAFEHKVHTSTLE